MSAITTRAVSYSVDDVALEGQLVFDSQASGIPGLVMAPNWMGVSAQAIATAKEVAAAGYVVFVADLYGQGVRPGNADEAGAAMMPVKSDPALLRRRMQAALAALKVEPNTPLDAARVAVFGFCFGGHCALELARSGAAVKAAISFHGTLDTADAADAANIQGPVLVLDGAIDPLVPREQLVAFTQEMVAAKVDWQLVSYAGAAHSFTDPGANVPGKMQYEPEVAGRAFAAMYGLLGRVFG